ncbi:unnamed protein product [Caenorhabditis sp. 36 PRJEB53466]|nr:unnamed protein product [Caenorhabditis sp. 36 PRJEB53466]
MPTMVMSQPPKTSNNGMRKRQKNKVDNIMAINYMFVGTPKKKFTFYVRERLVYRPNVEVTYDEVYNYLVHTTNDETLSLHYSVNGLYVPITTTGQLHTFIRLVHNDPNAFLYVENHDYVWNVTPQSKGHKMEKRVPNSVTGSAALPNEGDDEVDSDDDEEEGDSQDDEHGEEGTEEYEEDPEEQNTQDEEGDEDEEEAEDEEDVEDEMEEEEEEEAEEEEDGLPYAVTDGMARVVLAEQVSPRNAYLEQEKILKKQFAELSAEIPRFVAALQPNDPSALPSELILKQCSSHAEAMGYLKEVVSGAFKNRDIGQAPTVVAAQLVRDVWNKDVPFDEKVFTDTVEMLQSCFGAGLLHYFSRVSKKFPKDTKEGDKKELLDLKMTKDFMPMSEADCMKEFIENATIAACDMLECVQHLAALDREFEYFNEVNNRRMSEETNAKATEPFELPTEQELDDHLTKMVTAAHYGFQLLQPVFPKGCECHNTIRLLILELEKMHSVITHLFHKTSSFHHLNETKTFVLESLQAIMDRYTATKCLMHETVKMALEEAEAFKWRKDTTSNYVEWAELRDRGESRKVVQNVVNGTVIETPAPYAVHPSEIVPDQNITPIADLSELASSLTPMAMPLHATASMGDPVSNNPHSVTSQSIPEGSAANHTSVPPMSLTQESVIVEKTTKEVTATSSTTSVTDSSGTVTTTVTTTGGASGGGTATVEKKMSPELKKMVDAMMKNLPPQHNYVYPAPPKQGSIVIPTGGLARCRCSKNCTELLMEPAYEYVERFNEPRQTLAGVLRKGIFSFVVFEVTAAALGFAAFRTVRRSEEKRKYLYLNWPTIASSYYWVEDSISFGQLIGTRLKLSDLRRWAQIDSSTDNIETD